MNLRQIIIAVLVLGGAQLCSAKVNCKKELVKPLSLDQLQALVPQCPNEKAEIESRIKEKEESKKRDQEIEQIRRDGIGSRFVVPTPPIASRNIRIFIKDKGDFGMWGAPQCKAVNLDPAESLVFAIIDGKLVYIRGKGKILDGDREVLLGQ